MTSVLIPSTGKACSYAREGPIVLLASALPYESPTLPTDGSIPDSANRSVYFTARYCEPRSITRQSIAQKSADRANGEPDYLPDGQRWHRNV